MFSSLPVSAPARGGTRCRPRTAGTALWVALALAAETTFTALAATLTLQSGPQPGPWTATPISPAQLTPDGRLVVPSAAGAGFFRLEIAVGAEAGPLRHLDETPQLARDLAQEFIDRLRSAVDAGQIDSGAEGESTAGLTLGPIAAVYHDPTVGDGKTPAYVEFKLIRPVPPGRPQTDRIFGGRPEETDARSDAGYVLVSLTPADLPIGGYSLGGSTRFERLLARASGGAPVARIVRFDDAFMVAEDAAGRVVASLGSAPYLPDPAVLNLPPDGVEITLGSTGLPTGSTSPELTGRAPDSYAAFVSEWKTNPVFARAQAARAATAAEAWNFAGAGPKVITLQLRETAILNAEGPRAIRAATSAPGAIQVQVDEASGQVRATAVGNGEALVTLWQADGTSTVCVVETPDPAPGTAPTGPALHGTWIPGKKAGWHMAGEHFVSNWDEQRKYNQVLSDPQMCTGTVSGCGPTAWAMLYGHWDRKGFPRLFGNLNNADAPQFMGSPIQPSILECTRFVFDAVDELCFDKLDRAATLPHKMERGLQWASARGVGMTGSIKWGVPGLSPGSQSKALDSLRAGRISIVGIGFYSHYPIAYGYRRWEWRGKHGTIWRVTYDLRLNMGWGSGHNPEWRNIEQLWYATNLQPQ